MKIFWQGRDWYYDDRNVTVSVAKIVTNETGLMWPRDFADALTVMNPTAIQALMWLVRQQNGYQERIDDVDGSIVEFLEAYGEAAQQLVNEVDANPTDGAVESPTTISDNSETSIS